MYNKCCSFCQPEAFVDEKSTSPKKLRIVFNNLTLIAYALSHEIYNMFSNKLPDAKILSASILKEIQFVKDEKCLLYKFGIYDETYAGKVARYIDSYAPLI